MRKLLVCLCFFIAGAFFVHQIIKNVSDRNFKFAEKGTTFRGRLFSGISYELHRNGSLFRILYFWKGNQVATEHRWYPNGEKWEEIEYSNGMINGHHRIWYSNSMPKFFKNYSMGVPHGEFWGWHQNGNVSDYYYFENGQELIYKSFISDKKPFYNYVIKGTERIGINGGDFCKTQVKLSGKF